MSKVASMGIGKNITGDKKLNKVSQFTALGNPSACFPSAMWDISTNTI